MAKQDREDRCQGCSHLWRWHNCRAVILLWGMRTARTVDYACSQCRCPHFVVSQWRKEEKS